MGWKLCANKFSDFYIYKEQRLIKLPYFGCSGYVYFQWEKILPDLLVNAYNEAFDWI